MNLEDIQAKKKSAEQAIRSNNYALAEKLYHEILTLDHMDWEAPFMLAYCQAKKCIVAQIGTMAVLMHGATLEAVNQIAHGEMSDSDKQIALQCLVDKAKDISSQLALAAWLHHKNIGASIQANYNGEVISRVRTCLLICLDCGKQIVELFSGDETSYQIAAKAFASAYSTAAACSYAADRKANQWFVFNQATIFAPYFDAFAKCDSDALCKQEELRVNNQIRALDEQRQMRVRQPVTILTVLEAFILIFCMALSSSLGGATMPLMLGFMGVTALAYIGPVNASKDINRQIDYLKASQYCKKQ